MREQDMSTLGYTQTQKRSARRYWNAFTVVNSLSFTLLIGNFLTIYALRLGATSLQIGILSSIEFLAFFLMLPGRRAVARFGAIRSMSIAWTVRYLVSIPMALSPFIALRGSPALALALVFVGVIGFHTARGVGMVGNSPIMGELSAGKDRGRYLAYLQLLADVASLGTGLTIAFTLGEHAPLGRYGLFMIVAVVLGLIGAALLLRIPELPKEGSGARQGLLAETKTALARPAFRRFITAYALFATIIGMIRPFLVVYTKSVYLVSDSRAVLFTVIGSIGAITMSLVARRVMDHVGAKPIIVICGIVTAVSLLPAAVSPALGQTTLAVLLFFMFFAFTLGSIGTGSALQTYFYNIIAPEERVNLGMVYLLTMGATGFIGSAAGGSLLELLERFTHGQAAVAFRLFFIAGLTLLALTVAFPLRRLERLGGLSVISTLTTLLSYRDMRAIALLSRLDDTISIDQEREVIREIGTSHSTVAVEELIKRLASPSYIIRNEALHALDSLPSTPEVERALVEHVAQHEFTTSYLAARIVGRKRFRSAVPALRRALESQDYLLVAGAMVALAQLGDRESIGTIERILETAHNPMILIHGASALKLFGDLRSLPALIGVLKRGHARPFLREEIIFAVAGIIGFEEWFYPFFMAYRESPAEAVRLLRAELHAAGHDGRDGHEPLEALCDPRLLGTQKLADAVADGLERFARTRRTNPAVELIARETRSPELAALERWSLFTLALLVRLRTASDRHRI